MKVYKEKQFLIFDFEDGRTVKYDFAKKEAIGLKGKPVKDIKTQLQGWNLYQLMKCCEDPKYMKFLEYVTKRERRKYRYISNIGTILEAVPRYSRYEQIFSAGIDIYIDEGYSNFDYSINEIPKNLIKLAREKDFKLSNSIVQRYIEDPNTCNLAYNLDYMTLTTEDLNKILFDVDCGYFSTPYFNILIREYNYHPKSLLLYLDKLKTLEALNDIRKTLRELTDYAKMMNTISSKYDKYPKHFLSTHAIASRNYNRLKKEYQEELFKKRINLDYEIGYKNYVFIYPKCTQDIKDESVMMNNCVSSYIDDVLSGKCHILFLRKKESPDKSLVTIEVQNNKIVQAYRHFNYNVTPEDQEAIDYWNKKYDKKGAVA